MIDASGDGDVAARAGAPSGRRDKDEAPRLNDALMYRIEFGAQRPGRPVRLRLRHATPWSGGRPSGADQRRRRRRSCRRPRSTRACASTRTSPPSRRKHPELADARVVETPPLLGIRQTRFIEGEYKLTADDAIRAGGSTTSVAISPCPIIHYYGYRRYLEHEGYDIPYRCLVPQKVDNLLVAGRCISSEQQPYESHRAMVPIMAIGQAAGVAAALCCKTARQPRDLDVHALQQALLAQGVELRRRGPNWRHRRLKSASLAGGCSCGDPAVGVAAIR